MKKYLVRSISSQELKKYLQGETLVNKTNWREEGKRSDSVGFCFFPWDKRTDVVQTLFELGHFGVDHEDGYRYAIVLKPYKWEGLMYGHARYSDIRWGGYAYMEEYSCTEYSRDTMQIVGIIRLRSFVDSVSKVKFLSKAEILKKVFR